MLAVIDGKKKSPATYSLSGMCTVGSLVQAEEVHEGEYRQGNYIIYNEGRYRCFKV